MVLKITCGVAQISDDTQIALFTANGFSLGSTHGIIDTTLTVSEAMQLVLCSA